MVQEISDMVPKDGPRQASVTPLSAIRNRAAKVSNLWIFDSPKNNRRLTVSGDVPYMHLVLLEGDTSVAGYDLIDDPFSISSSNDSGYVRVRYRNGDMHWLVIKRHGRARHGKANDEAISEALRGKACEAGVSVHRLTELDLAGKEILLDNWLTLCAIMTRARSYPSYLETEQLLTALSRHGVMRVSDVLALPRADPAIMLSVVAKALQEGIVQTELTRRIFGLHSELKQVRP